MKTKGEDCSSNKNWILLITVRLVGRGNSVFIYSGSYSLTSTVKN